MCNFVETTCADLPALFLRVFSGLGNLSHHMRRASAGDKVLMRGGIMKGDRDYGGPKFDRLYHNLKVLLLL